MIKTSNRKDLSIVEIEEIIKKYYSEKSDYTKRFIKLGIMRYGDIYDYSKTDRIDNNHTKVTIICPMHGEFQVDPQYFLKSPFSKGCPICNPTTRRQVSTDEFMDRLNEIFPEYEPIDGETKYINNHTNISLICSKHNRRFSSRPSNLLIGRCGCEECAKESRERSRYITEERKFRKKVSKLNELYDFGDYFGEGRDIKIYCKKHNIYFYMTPEQIYRRLKNSQPLCPECFGEERQRRGTAKFIEKCESRYPERFDYSSIKYINRSTIVSGIKCLHCGESFSIYPGNFLLGHGCPICNKSEGEILIEEWITENNALGTIDEFKIHEKFSSDLISGRKDGWGVEIDFIVISKNGEFWIEYSGEQHYSWCKHFHKTIDEFNGQIIRDQNVRDFCKNNSKTLIEIPWTFSRDLIKDALTEIIVEGKDPAALITLPEITYNRNKEKKYGNK